MSYATQSIIAQDRDFLNRCTSAAAIEVPFSVAESPESWVAQHNWRLATSPGFDTKYESALAAGIGRPGWEPSVIPDADILAAVQAILAAEAAA